MKTPDTATDWNFEGSGVPAYSVEAYTDLARERDALRAALEIARDAMVVHMWNSGLFYVRSGQYARDIARIKELADVGGSH